MKKKLEMNLLNDEKLHEVAGGSPPMNLCTRPNDVVDVDCGLERENITRWCQTYEASCSNGGFTFKCGLYDFSCAKGADFKLSPWDPAKHPDLKYPK